MTDFTDQCAPQDDAAYWYRVQLQECDGCRGGHYELQRHRDGRWLCEGCMDEDLIINGDPAAAKPHGKIYATPAARRSHK